MLYLWLSTHKSKDRTLPLSHNVAAGEMSSSPTLNSAKPIFSTQPLNPSLSHTCRQRVTCRFCGTGAGVVSVTIPYVLRYLASELAAMNIKPVSHRQHAAHSLPLLLS